MVDHGELILSQAARPAFVLDDQGSIVNVNADFEELIGIPSSRIVKTDFQDVFTSKSQNDPRPGQILHLLQAGDKDHFLHGKDGKKIPVRLESVSFTREGREHRVVFLFDSPESKDLFAQDLHMARLASLGKVLAGVIHEMSNPLAVINGCAQLLSMESLPEEIEEHVQRIYSETRRTSDLIKKVLSFARKEKEEKERFQLPDVVEEAAVLKDFSLKNDNIKIVRRHNNASPLLVEGYKVQLTQVVLNLLNNSEQAIRGDAGSGKIFVETNRCDRNAMISISDNGPGISPEVRNRVFDAFFTTKDENQGTGLGLYISRQIIQNHGGDLSLASSNGDQTVFQIRLPLLNPEDISKEDAKTAEAGLL